MELRNSTSRRRTFRTCGYKYYLRYIEGWQPKKENAAFTFGKVMHAVAGMIIAPHMVDKEIPIDGARIFEDLWARYQTDPKIAWPKTRPWEFYRGRGNTLAKLMSEELPKRIKKVHLMEVPLEYDIVEGVREIGIPDVFCDFVCDDGKVRPAVIDFKTTMRPYDPLQIEMDEQLTDYQLALERHGHKVERLVLCVLQLGTTPIITWHVADARDNDEKEHFISSAILVDRAIKSGAFIRNDRACFSMGRCEYVPLCYKSQAKEVENELEKLIVTDGLETISFGEWGE